MLVRKDFYGVKCDRCGKMQTFNCEGDDCSESDAGANFEIDEDAALAVAESNDWHIDAEEGKHYCDECWEKIIDEEEMMEEESNYQAYEELKRLEPDVYD